MKLNEAYEAYKKFKVPSLSEIRDIASENSKTSLVIIILLVVLLLLALQYIPHYQVAQFGITDQKDLADAENSYRATLAQLFGGVAIAIGIYYTWRRITIAEEDLKATQENLKVTQENLKVFQEGQITERFTRAIEQLGAVDQQGNPAIEIRLGAIYALERIANGSDKDYWPIMEILTAYVRKNSRNEMNQAREKFILVLPDNVSLDIQAILTVIGRRKVPSGFGEKNSSDWLKTLDLQGTFLRKTNLFLANLSEANLEKADLEEADLMGANLEEAKLFMTNLKGANFTLAHLERATFIEANLEGAEFKNTYLNNAILGGANLKDAFFYEADLRNAYFKGAILEGTGLFGTNLEGASLTNANLNGAYLQESDLRGAKNLTVDQLSKTKTLYKAQLDPELEKELRAKDFGHLLDDEPEDDI